MPRKQHAGRWRAAYAPVVRRLARGARPKGSAPAAHARADDVVTDADRAYLARVAEGNAAARAGDRAAGSLAVAFERMGMIERAMGIDVRATALAHWGDRGSHLSLLAAVREKKAVAGTDVGMEGSP